MFKDSNELSIHLKSQINELGMSRRKKSNKVNAEKTQEEVTKNRLQQNGKETYSKEDQVPEDFFFFVRHDIGEINQDKKVQKANVSSEEECHFESFRY